MNKTRQCLAALAALTLSLQAAAHPGHVETGFAAGFLHPLTGIDHLLALLAVGLWSRQQQGEGRGAMLPPAFLMMMALGASTGLALPALETSVAATVLLLGGLAARGRRLAPELAVLLVGGCGLLHGLAHGRELAGIGSGAGFLLASAGVMAIGALARQERLRRMLGAAIGAAGLCLLAAAV